MKVCPHCGAPVRNNQRICDGCGEQIDSGNQSRRNLIMSFLAVVSFALGICGIGIYTAQHRRMVLAEEEKARQEEQAKEKRAEELAAEALEEKERLEKALASSSAVESSGKSEVQPKDEPAESVYTDLSKLAQQDLKPLIQETGAIQTETGGEHKEYHTENDAVVLAYTETGYSVSLDSECIYSLYGVYVGMKLEEALEHLDSRGFKRTEDEEEICYKIDEIDLLYIFDDGSEVSRLRLDVLVEDVPLEDDEEDDLGEEDTQDGEEDQE